LKAFTRGIIDMAVEAYSCSKMLIYLILTKAGNSPPHRSCAVRTTVTSPTGSTIVNLSLMMAAYKSEREEGEKKMGHKKSGMALVLMSSCMIS